MGVLVDADLMISSMYSCSLSHLSGGGTACFLLAKSLQGPGGMCVRISCVAPCRHILSRCWLWGPLSSVERSLILAWRPQGVLLKLSNLCLFVRVSD